MRLKELRTQKGVTQKKVADEIKCSTSTYAKYEREEREPDIETLKRLSKYFKATVDYIIDNDIEQRGCFK